MHNFTRYINHSWFTTGICFGHQIISCALGGECLPNGGVWEIGPTQIQLTDIGKQLFGPSDTLVCKPI